jgi:hypothetical protein
MGFEPPKGERQFFFSCSEMPDEFYDRRSNRSSRATYPDAQNIKLARDEYAIKESTRITPKHA